MGDQIRKIYEFDNFSLDVCERQLLKDARPVVLTRKAFEVLVVLVENSGHLVERDTLHQRVWPESIVEDANLTVQISTIRKALEKPAYIATVAGHGYRFTRPVKLCNGAEGNGSARSIRVGTHSVEACNEIANAETAPLKIESDVKELTIPQAAISSVALQPRIGAYLKLLIVVIGLTGVGAAALLMSYPGEGSAEPTVSLAQPTITKVTDSGRFGGTSISPDGRLIAYTDNGRGGSGSLFVHDLESNNVNRLIPAGERNFGCTAFSRDISRIYFLVTDTDHPGSALFSIPVRGGSPDFMIEGVRWCFALSPSEDQVAFYRDDPTKRQKSLVISPRDGRDERALFTRTYDEMLLGYFPAWSPDGRLIAYDADPESGDLEPKHALYAFDLVSGKDLKLSDERFAGVGSIKWTSDGKKLIFVGKRARGENQIWLMDYPSGEVRAITNDVVGYGNYGVSVTQDSQTLAATLWDKKEELGRIELTSEGRRYKRLKFGAANGRSGMTVLPDESTAYITQAGGNVDIWTIGRDGLSTKPVTSDEFVERDVASSPDGRYLVFSSDVGGSFKIFRMNADDGSGVTQLTFGPTSDTLPSISPDGSTVAFTSFDGAISAVASVSINGGRIVRLTDYSCLAPVFSPDGKTLACMIPAGLPGKESFIALISFPDGKPERYFRFPPANVLLPRLRWMPDGKGIAFITFKDRAYNIREWSFASNAVRPLTDFSSGAVWNFEFTRGGDAILLSRGETYADVVIIKNFQ